MDAQETTLSATEQDPGKRAAWWAAVAGVRAARMVVRDETSASIRLTRTHARAPLTQLGALTAATFTAYVRDVLCPRLRPGQVVILDNASIHKGAAVREAIEAARCSLLFLPPSSPDFAPIELAFAKLKAALRAAGARTHEALHAAIAAALRRITPADARGYFTHCGYSFAQRHRELL